MKKKMIPKKNYIILAALTVFTVLLCFYLVSWYKTIDNYNKNNSVMTSVISEINIDSLSNILLENPDVIIYLSSSKDADVKSFEKQFKKIVVNNDLSDEIVYIDISKKENKNVTNVLIDNYLSKGISLKKIVYPNILIFKEGKIYNILYLNKTNITKVDALKFFERNGVIND